MKIKSFAYSFVALTLLSAFNGSLSSAFAQGTGFTYQGRFFDGTNVANGNYDMRFHIYGTAAGNTLIAGPITNAPIAVSNGLFTVILDFGTNVFIGSSNWLQIGARTNGSASGYIPLSPRQQLTPTPYAIFAETANASGLTGAIPAGDLSGVSGSGLTGVALLAGGNTFTGNQSINGMLNINDGSGATTFTDLTIGPGGYTSGEQHSVNFDDGAGHIASLIAGYNGANGYFSVGNLYNSGHRNNPSAFAVYGDGDVNVDPANLNSGFLNDGNTNSSGLTFGFASGEGIASKRTAGGNQYGLDFYTAFTTKMTLANNGYVGIGRSTPINGATWLDVHAPVTNAFGGMYVETAGAGLPFYGYVQNGVVSAYSYVDGLFFNDWFLVDGSGTLTLTSGGNLGVDTSSPSEALEVNGEYMMVDGLGGVKCYIGDDGSGNDVQIGSLTHGITAVACYNATDDAYMHLYCSSITIEGGADLAEPFKITSGNDEVPQGAVVVIDEENPGHLKMSDESYDTHVAGVVSGANGINPGIQMQQQGLLDGGKNVALTGRVYVQADTSNGAIKPGDLLTTSSNPGRAMKVTDHARAAGAILGKAMTGLSEGKGMVLVLVTLQ